MNYRLIKGIIVFIIIFNTAFGRDLQPDNTVFNNLKGLLVSTLKPSELSRGLDESYGKWSKIQYPSQGLVGYKRGASLTIRSSYLSSGENRLNWKKLDFGPDDLVPFANPGVDIGALDELQAGEMLMQMPIAKLPGLLNLLQQEQSRWLWQQESWQNIHLQDGQFVLVKPWQKSVTHKKLPFLHSQKPQHFEWIHAGEILWNESNRLIFGHIETLKLDELIFPEIKSYHFLLRNPQDRGLIAAVAADDTEKYLLLVDRGGRKYEKAADLEGDFLSGVWNPNGESFSWLEQKGDAALLKTLQINDFRQTTQVLPGKVAEYAPKMSYSPDGLALFLLKNSSKGPILLKLSGGKLGETALSFRRGAIEAADKIAFSASRLEDLSEKMWFFASLQIDGQRSLYEMEVAPELLNYQPLETDKLPKTTNHNQLIFFEEVDPVAKNYTNFVKDMKESEERFVFFMDFQEQFIELPKVDYNPEQISYFAFNCANNQLKGFAEQKERLDSETMRKMTDLMQRMVSDSRKINSDLMAIQKQVMKNPAPYSKDSFKKWDSVMDEFENDLDGIKAGYKNSIGELNESLAALQKLNNEFADFLEAEHGEILEKAQQNRDRIQAFRQAQSKLSYHSSDKELVKLLNREMKWFFRQVERSGDVLTLQMVQMGDIEECDYRKYHAKILQQDKALQMSLEIAGQLIDAYEQTAGIFAGDDKKAHRATLLAHLHLIRPALEFADNNQTKVAELTEILNEYSPGKELWFWHYNTLLDGWKKYLENK
jgi:hypothetical protein